MFDFIEDPVARQKAIDEHNAGIDNIKVDTQNLIKTEVEKATSGLKQNHDKLLDEKKKLQERFKDIKDPDEALAALAMLNDNPDLKLIKEGKLEEVISKRVSESSAEFEERIKTLSDQLNEKELSSTRYQSLFTDTVRDMRLKEAAITAGVLPTAIVDILNRGKEIFTVAEDERNVEARDKNGKLKKINDTTILTAEVWIETLRKDSPHFWPQSKGANLNPGKEASDLEAQIAEAAANKNTKLFRELRNKQKALGSGK